MAIKGWNSWKNNMAEIIAMATMANFAEISKFLKSSETAQGFNDNNGSHTNSDLNGFNDIWLYIMAPTLVGSVVLEIMVKIGIVTLKVVMAIMVTIAV